jgi:hypothetical protein
MCTVYIRIQFYMPMSNGRTPQRESEPNLCTAAILLFHILNKCCTFLRGVLPYTELECLQVSVAHTSKVRVSSTLLLLSAGN